ncbi:hypothetical protein DL93DRAFT_2099555 [Clavulina sp. PMI_390]|nr:hypothetical protein DL93DRAFT_2099555 [Clavulina sp. PMI_390]
MTVTSIPLYHYSLLPFITSSPPLLEIPGEWKLYNPRDFGTTSQVRQYAAWPRRQLKIATWNVWFDPALCELRWKMLIEALEKGAPDVVCLQEVTPKFQEILLTHHVARSTYLTTHISDETAITNSWYGTIILVRRKLVFERGCEASVTFEGYENMGNTHLEYTPRDRARQMSFCISRLSRLPPPLYSSSETPVASPAEQTSSAKKKSKASSTQEPDHPPIEHLELGVLCGDTNIESYAEIEENMVQKGWKDLFVIADNFAKRRSPPTLVSSDTHPGADADADADTETAGPSEEAAGKVDSPTSAAQINLFTDIPSFGIAGLEFKGKVSKERIGRLDYLLAKAFPDTPSLPYPSTSTATTLPDGAAESSSGAPSVRKDGQVSLPATNVYASNARFLGAEPIAREVVKRWGNVDDETMSVWPSDHLGVVVNVWVGV